MRISEYILPESTLPEWLFRVNNILGFTEEEESEDEESEDEESEDEDEDEEGKKKGKKDDDEEDEKDAGLKSALKKERLARREAQKNFKTLKTELDAFKAAADEGKSKDDKDKAVQTSEAQKKADAAEAKTTRLAARLATAAVDTAITRVLQDPKLNVKFKDADDVLHLINRKDIDVDQDDDDPSEIEVDEDDIRREVKALAKRKPHLLVSEKDDEGEGEKGTGGKFGGSKGKADKEAERAALLKKYPALTRR